MEKLNLIELKVLRTEKEELDTKYNELYDKFKEDNKELMDKRNYNKDKIDVVDTKIRTEALSEYEINKEKSLEFGVGIRVTTKLNYDSKIAYDWALEHKMALQLDKKSFEKIAKETKPEFVEFKETPTATIPTNISLEE